MILGSPSGANGFLGLTQHFDNDSFDMNSTWNWTYNFTFKVSRQETKIATLCLLGVGSIVLFHVIDIRIRDLKLQVIRF